MGSTTKKHDNFVLEPMGDKAVTDVAGIGPVYGGKLAAKGITKAYELLGQFLLMKKDKELFVDWLVFACGANRHNAEVTYKCLYDWANAFL